MSISAQDVKLLRDKTGAGMMDCKKALVDANGDFTKAEKILKELGLAAADKRSGRAANDGKIFTLIKDDKAIILELSCETDFVARNSDFNKLGKMLLTTIYEQKITAINEQLETMVKDTVGIIKENMALRRFAIMEIKNNETAVEYIHGDGKIGVVVKLQVENSAQKNQEKLKTTAFDLALHIAAFAPLYLSREKIDAAFIAEQEEIFQKQAANLEKPANVINGIVKGKLNKYLAEVCLVDQGFVRDEKIKVSQVMEDLSKALGTKISLAEYFYYKVGTE